MARAVAAQARACAPNALIARQGPMLEVKQLKSKPLKLIVQASAEKDGCGARRTTAECTASSVSTQRSLV